MCLQDISVFYDGVPAVRSASLSIRQGEVLALIGPSGCGKTTLLRSLNRLTELTKTARLDGRITIDDLASGLRMVTTAEGVESLDQLERLRAEGCIEAQGFVFSQPMEGAKVRAYLAEHRRLYGASVDSRASFRSLLVEAGLEKAARNFSDLPQEARRAAG